MWFFPLLAAMLLYPDGITSYNQNTWDPDKHEAQQRSTEGVCLHIGHEAQESTEKLAEHQVGLGEKTSQVAWNSTNRDDMGW